MGRTVPEQSGINLYSEHSLHEQLKAYLAGPGDRHEALVGGKVIDLVRADGELVEVQTAQLGKIKAKALDLAGKGYRVRIVYPVPVERHIRRLDPVTNELASSRKSPKRGDNYSLFDALIHAPELISAPNITVEVVFVKSVEIKVRDGTGSWWRKGDRTIDKELVEVVSSRSFCTQDEWMNFIPANLAPPWSSIALGEACGISVERARRILYCLCRAGLLAETGKMGRSKLYKET
jgi:hypothetical protein